MSITNATTPNYRPPERGGARACHDENPANGASRAPGLRSTTDALPILKELDDMLSSQQPCGTVTSRNSLSCPAQAFSAEEMVSLLRTLTEKLGSARLNAAKKNIETDQVEANQNNEKLKATITTWIEKSKAAETSSGLGKIFGWIGKIAAFVGSLAAVVALSAGSVVTGGAATPLLVVATIALISSGMALVDQVSQELGGPEISFGNVITQTVAQVLQAFGVSEETAEKVGKTLAGATALILPALLLIEPSMMGDLLSGVCGLAGVDEKTLGTISMVATLVTGIGVAVAMTVFTAGGAAGIAMAKIAQAGGLIASGVSQAGQGVTGIVSAKYHADADKAVADKKKLTAIMQALYTHMQEERDTIKQVLLDIDESTQAVTRLITDTADSMHQITHNLRGPSTAPVA